MQNFGMPAGGPTGQPGGGAPAMYGGGGMMSGPPMAQVHPHINPQTQMHNYKMQLQQWNSQQCQQIQQMNANNPQISQQQIQSAFHRVNEQARQAFTQFHSQLMQRMGGAGLSEAGQWRGQAQPGTMPPPMAPVPGQMQREMTATEKKKMMEMQKRMAAQQAQQQAMRPGFPPGTTPQQQQQLARMHAMQQQQQQQQQQNMQNNGYPRMMQQPGQPGQTPQYPVAPPLSHQPAGMQPLQHMQAPTPQSHGPASVSTAAHQQFQQQQFYQQQNQQQLHMQQQQLQMQQQQQQLAAQQQGMSQEGGFQQPGHMSQQHPQQGNMQQMQQQPQQQHQPQEAAQQPQPAAAPQPAPAPAPPPQKPEDLRYKELLKEMKNQYLEVIEGMQRRQTQQKGLVQMINILQGDRIVPYEQLLGLKSSLHRLMIRDCPTFPMMEEIRKVVFKRREDREKAALMTFGEKESISAAAEKAEKRLSRFKSDDDPLGVASWKSVTHLKIRVPESIRKLTQRTVSPSPLEEKRRAIKRERDEDADDEDPMAKRPKEEDRDETGSQTSVDEDPSQISPTFVIKTVFDNRRPWIIPPKAREELRQLNNWSIDEHCLPSCSTAPFIIICVKAQSLLVNPLRISLPRTYPQDAASVQFDRSFPQDSDYGPALQKLYEKNLGTKSAVKGLKDFVVAYHAACEEYQMYSPKYQVESSPEQQQQKTPEMMYANHYAARPAATAPIAHKGMVM